MEKGPCGKDRLTLYGLKKIDLECALPYNVKVRNRSRFFTTGFFACMGRIRKHHKQAACLHARQSVMLYDEQRE